MFDLTDGRAYHWLHILIVLSWEGFDQYLPEIRFPLVDDIERMRPIARKMLKSFLATNQRIEDGLNISTHIQTLFDTCYDEFIVAVGETKMRKFVEWGSLLKVNHQIRTSTNLISEALKMALRPDSSTHTPIPEHIQATIKSNVLQSLAEFYRIDNAIILSGDSIEADAWMATISREYMKAYYQHGGQFEIIGIVLSWIGFYQDVAFIHSLARSLTQNDLHYIDALIRSNSGQVAILSFSETIAHTKPYFMQTQG